MTKQKKFFLGGGGALAPLLVSFIVADVDTLIMYFKDLSNNGIYELAGYATHVAGLFVLGGVWASLHKSERDPKKLFQLGVVAPAVITAMLNASNVEYSKGNEHVTDIGISFSLISTAHAKSTDEKKKAMSAFDKFIKGLLKRR